ncbi:hypothetical protein KDL45_16995 [bacterium]|nr:hypothetical protein [bacterium]MCB1232988.1 hypothetical protein [Verrucomicrobiae bacterium]
MLDREKISQLLNRLDAKLGARGITGEICLYGGTVMCLVYNARPATKDVDAVFEPTSKIREACLEIAAEDGLAEDWLNDAVKGYVVDHPTRTYLELANLRVLVPEPDYLLAMKALAARFDTNDRDDVIFLIGKLGLKSAKEAFEILQRYYPIDRLRPATRFFIEELLPEDS